MSAAAGRGQRGGHAGHHVGGDPGRAQRIQLLTASAEHERVTALEPHHLQAGARSLDELRGDVPRAGPEQ
jgi:hypothetical protein